MTFSNTIPSLRIIFILQQDNTLDSKSKSEVRAQEFYTAIRIKTHLDNTLYLSSLWSDLSCAADFVIAGDPAGFTNTP